MLQLKKQEPPLDHPDSCNQFLPGPDKPFIATPEAIAKYSYSQLLDCLFVLQAKARRYGGIDYLQVFESETGERLWFIEDGQGGAITALLPTEY